MANNRRRHDRLDTQIEKVLTAEWNGRPIGTIVDFSRGGMLIRFECKVVNGIVETELMEPLLKKDFFRRLNDSIGLSLPFTVFSQDIEVGKLHAALIRVEEEAGEIFLAFRFDAIRENLLNKLIAMAQRKA